jgi:hypothetical protein
MFNCGIWVSSVLVLLGYGIELRDVLVLSGSALFCSLLDSVRHNGRCS